MQQRMTGIKGSSSGGIKTNKASVSLSDTEASSENGDYLLSHCYAVPSA